MVAALGSVVRDGAFDGEPVDYDDGVVFTATESYLVLGARSDEPEGARREVRVELLGNDRPGIVGAVSGVLARHGLSVAQLESGTRDAPMAGGRLFEATAVATVPADTDLEALQTDLEELATEIMVDVSLTTQDLTAPE